MTSLPLLVFFVVAKSRQIVLYLWGVLPEAGPPLSVFHSTLTSFLRYPGTGPSEDFPGRPSSARFWSGAGSGREDRRWAPNVPWLCVLWAPSTFLLLSLLDNKVDKNSTYFGRRV